MNKNPIRFVGEKLLNTSLSIGKATSVLYQIVFWILRGEVKIKESVKQLYEVGVASLPVIVLTSFFTGMVLAFQTGSASTHWIGEPIYIGSVVGFSMVKELGPVLTAVVLAGRVGAAITAELGTMKVTEQIDALYTLGTNPISYLAIPKFLGCVIGVPILTIFSDIVGILGGLFVSVYYLNISSTAYWSQIVDFMYIDDFFQGLIKAVFFGFIIAVISIYKGFMCKGGAKGVGKASTSSVVVSMVLILVSNYFLTSTLVTLGIGVSRH